MEGTAGVTAERAAVLRKESNLQEAMMEDGGEATGVESWVTVHDWQGKSKRSSS